MKYDLTIRDIDANQLSEVLKKLNGEITVTTSKPDVVLPFIAAQNTEASNATGGEDVDALLNASTNTLIQSGKTDERDSEGFVWDERIHSGSKKKNADGRWKLMKNVDLSLVAAVKAELSGKASPVMAAPVAPASQPTDLPAFLQRGPLPPVVQPVTAPATVPATSVAPVTAPVTHAAAPIARDFSGLMLKISNLFATKQITADYPKTIVDRINQGFGAKIATLTDVANDPRMIEYGWQCLEVDGKAA